MCKPDWFLLIEQWKIRKKGAIGITLPFLVGALARKSVMSTVTEQDIHDVLEAIVHYPVEGFVTRVQWCHDIKAPVLSVASLSSPYRWATAHSFKNNAGREVLAFSSDFDSHFEGCENERDCIERFADWARPFVIGGQFSRRAGEFGPFLPEDIEFIEQALSASEKSDLG